MSEAGKIPSDDDLNHEDELYDRWKDEQLTGALLVCNKCAKPFFEGEGGILADFFFCSSCYNEILRNAE